LVLDRRASERNGARFLAMVERRAAGEPLQYVLGSWGFRGLDLFVDDRVLIPRPETEQVVEAALGELDRLTSGAGDQRAPVVVDLGTGSGAIALAVATERPGTVVWATDVSAGALEVASANLAGTGTRGATRVRLVRGCWWDALPAALQGVVDLVISNPPYISSGEMGTLPAEVAGWEPRTALEAGVSGLEAIEVIIAGARRWLRPGGALVLEMAPSQAGPVAGLARAAGFSGVEVRDDLAGRPRTLVAR
jgi:release factor glutamine methyltransferase